MQKKNTPSQSMPVGPPTESQELAKKASKESRKYLPTKRFFCRFKLLGLDDLPGPSFF